MHGMEDLLACRTSGCRACRAFNTFRSSAELGGASNVAPSDGGSCVQKGGDHGVGHSSFSPSEAHYFLHNVTHATRARLECQAMRLRPGTAVSPATL